MNVHFEDAQRFVVSDLENDAFNVSGEKPIFELTAVATCVLSLAQCTIHNTIHACVEMDTTVRVE